MKPPTMSVPITVTIESVDDVEIDAMQVVWSAMKQLPDNETRARVLAWATSRVSHETAPF